MLWGRGPFTLVILCICTKYKQQTPIDGQARSLWEFIMNIVCWAAVFPPLNYLSIDLSIYLKPWGFRGCACQENTTLLSYISTTLFLLFILRQGFTRLPRLAFLLSLHLSYFLFFFSIWGYRSVLPCLANCISSFKTDRQKNHWSLVWWSMPIILALRRLV